MLAATLPLTYTNSWAHPDSIPELALFTIGCHAIVGRRDRWFVAALVVAALNRETAIFLVGAYWVSRQPDRGHFIKKCFVFNALLLILGGIRAWRGLEHYDYWQLSRNFKFLGLLPPGYDLYKRFYAWFIVVLAGPALAIIAAGWSHVPGDARRLVWSASPLAGVGLLFSSIIEPRIFMPFYPMLLPALLCVLVQPKKSDKERSLGN